jgi:LemA protein
MFKWPNAFKWVGAALMALTLSGCGYNTLQTTDEDIKATWAEVLNQYQRRADLVPNLVNVVEGYAAHEKDVLTGDEARARVGAIQATPELINDEAAFQKFIAAQGELTGAISRLLLVAENYPQLKADGLFRDLQAQLEGTENRITVANRYITASSPTTSRCALPQPPRCCSVSNQADLHGGKREGDCRSAPGRFWHAGSRAGPGGRSVTCAGKR